MVGWSEVTKPREGEQAFCEGVGGTHGGPLKLEQPGSGFAGPLELRHLPIQRNPFEVAIYSRVPAVFEAG